MNSTVLRAISIIGCAAVVLGAAFDASAQRKKTKPDASPGASLSQIIGIDRHITATYHRPGVKGLSGKSYATRRAPHAGFQCCAGLEAQEVLPRSPLRTCRLCDCHIR